MDYSCIFNQRAQSYINASVNWPAVREHEFAAYLDSLHLKPGERFLDVPCGTGIVAARIDDRVNYFGLDPSGPTWPIARHRASPF
jgi:cyclopropane fatty-acyl-phospholipid synthase-like methyltransferase